MATAKKIQINDYNVVLTLSAVEARYLSAITGRINGNRPVQGIWGPLSNVVGEPPKLIDDPTFCYESLSKSTRDWVENGE